MARHARWLTSVVPAATCLAAAGCPGSLSFSKLDAFEEVRSAVWLEQDVDAPWDPELVHHVLALSPEPGLCDAYQEAYAGWNERMAELDAAFDADSQCAVLREAYGEMSVVLGTHAGPGSALVKLSFLEYGEHGQRGVEPVDGDYPVTTDPDHVAYLTVELFHQDVYAWTAAGYEVVDGVCVNADTLIPVVGLDLALAGPDVVERYYGSSGTATVEHRGPSALHVDLGARLWKDGGEVEGQFTARHCAVAIDGVGDTGFDR